ncbi:hypothetical protein Y032_0005g2465 [Ancylostoma ceylanicum]|uniref:Uncharacterized protein n=1 Tax=Ancylostoma ceylanicum TaxID=53326 RepID=A0A016VTR4_9BILA|nr:hypothetical protein Y032_0005g2465 [Ancylostoma ceylanicum]
MVRIARIHCARPPTAMALAGASFRRKPAVAVAAILVSLQIGHRSLCSFHICDVLTLYFTTHASAPSRGPAGAAFKLLKKAGYQLLCIVGHSSSRIYDSFWENFDLPLILNVLEETTSFP